MRNCFSTFIITLCSLIGMLASCSEDEVAGLGNDWQNTYKESNPGYLYDADDVPVVTITVAEADWNEYLSNYDNNPDNGIYVPAKFAFNKGDKNSVSYFSEIIKTLTCFFA